MASESSRSSHAREEEHRVRLDNPADAARLAEWMSAGEVLAIHSREGTLEDVFVARRGTKAVSNEQFVVNIRLRGNSC